MSLFSFRLYFTHMQWWQTIAKPNLRQCVAQTKYADTLRTPEQKISTTFKIPDRQLLTHWDALVV